MGDSGVFGDSKTMKSVPNSLYKPAKKASNPTKDMITGAKTKPVGKMIKDTLLGSFKKGGKVKKTGNYKLHKGEKVVPAKKVKKERMTFEKARKKHFNI